MSNTVSMEQVLQLTVAERIQLVQDIWDSIAAVPEAVVLTVAQREELDRRLEAYHRDPDAGTPWREVLARVRGRERLTSSSSEPGLCPNGATQYSPAPALSEVEGASEASPWVRHGPRAKP